MIILHGGVFERDLFIWGEVPLDADHPVSKKVKERGPIFLPYDAGFKKLSSALREVGLGIKTGKESFKTMILWLPTRNGSPSVSSEMIGETLEASPPDTFSPWKITALKLSREGVVELLCQSVGKRILAPGIILGRDLIFWARVLQFSGALIAKEQFIPTIERGPKSFFARWEPIFWGKDSIRLSNLAKAMPGVCRALSNEADNPPKTPSMIVLKDFITVMVDSIIRLGFKGRRLWRRRFTGESIHDQWLDNLLSSSSSLKGDQKELSKFLQQVEDWRRPLAISMRAPVRLCFRIEEPDGERSVGERWYVRYLLQSIQDPSLILSAEEVWKEGYPSIMKEGFNLHEYLLLSLGQASRICPYVERSLRAANPAGYELDVRGAYEFLTQKARLFEQWGFGVMLPSWWTDKGTKLRFTARANVRAPKMRGVSGLSLNEIVQFDWEISLGEEVLSYEELQKLARLKAPLIRVRGQWVEVNSEEIEAVIEFWRKKRAGETTLREVIRMALDGGSLLGGIPLEGIRTEGWVGDLISKLRGHRSFEELPKPEGFQGDLRPYQVRGYSWLSFLRDWGFGACLADDMGLGKTIQTLTLIQRDWELGKRRPVLLICPTSIVNNWKKEASRFTPELPVLIHHGVERKRGEEFKEAAQRHALVISSYALLSRDFEILKEIDWGGIVLDEAQNIKNPETKQSRAARSLRAEYRITLTGTPVENSVGDLWSIMEFLNPGFLGNQAEFKRNFFIPIQAARDPEAEERLRRLTGPFILRRLKTDKNIISDLPEKVEMKVFCNLTKEQASLYEAVVSETMGRIDESEGIERKGLVLSTIMKLKQVCNHPAQFLGDNSKIPGRSGKLERLTEMVEEMMEVGDRALIFSQFAEMGAILKRYLEETFGREVLFLHGGVEKKKRDWMVERFQSEENGPHLFILSLKAGGTGLNLTKANQVIHFDRWWNPAVENQATDRTFRIGQKRNVMVHKFICAGTLEEKIDEMIERKKEIADRVVETGEGWLTELSTDELKELFTLRREAIGD
jgi:SNF2 family DNA or RNA helicase